MKKKEDEKFILNDIIYNNFNDACIATYEESTCKCFNCNKQLSLSSWRNRVWKGTHSKPLCKSCMTKERNKINHDANVRRLIERNNANWKDPEYRERMSNKMRAQNIEWRKDPVWIESQRLAASKTILEYNASDKRKEDSRRYMAKSWETDEIFKLNPRLYFEIYRPQSSNKPTVVYLGNLYTGENSNNSYRGLDGDKYFKLGISSNIKARKYYYGINNGVDNYETLREFPNRRQAGLCEYLASIKFATNGEACPIENKEDYVNFVNNFDYDKEKELIKPYLEKYYPEDLK